MPKHIVKSDKPFITGMFMLSGFYVVMIVLMVLANLAYLAKPVKDPAPVTDIAGIVTVGSVENGQRIITVTNADTKESRQYQIKAKYMPLYESGESVAKNKKLIDREVSGIPAMRMTLAPQESSRRPLVKASWPNWWTRSLAGALVARSLTKSTPM